VVVSQIARYDGHAEWYDETFSAFHNEEEEAFLRECLGAGDDRICLDVACGTGRYGRVLADAGYRSVGFDISADQLRFARRRLGAAVRADARQLPVQDASVAAAAGMFFHTDVEDFAAVVRDVTRCLRPGGRFFYLGTHPCFVGPFVNRMTESKEPDAELRDRLRECRVGQSRFRRWFNDRRTGRISP